MTPIRQSPQPGTVRVVKKPLQIFDFVAFKEANRHKLFMCMIAEGLDTNFDELLSPHVFLHVLRVKQFDVPVKLLDALSSLVDGIKILKNWSHSGWMLG